MAITGPSIIETPQSAQVLSLSSRAFKMAYPEVLHQESITSDALGRMQPTWNTPDFPERQVTVSILNEVYVAQEGLVFDAHGNLFASSVTQHEPDKIALGFNSVQKALRSGCEMYCKRTAVLCKKRGADNYGHWLMEMLPKAYLSRLFLDHGDLDYLVSYNRNSLRTVIQDSLAMLDITRRRTLETGFEAVKVQSLVLFDGLTNHGVYMSPMVMDCIESVSARVQAKPSSKVFVTRESQSTRRLVDEAPIQELARMRGYEIVDPGSLTFSEQISVFKSAKHVVGVMGAGMTNIALAPRHCRVTVLAPAGMPDTFFWFMAGLKGQRYEEIRCGQAENGGSRPDADRDIFIRHHDIENLFDAEL